MKRTLIFSGVLLVLLLPLHAKEGMRVGIRDGYLKSMGYKDVWSAAKAIGVERLELEVTPELRCPNLYEADGTTHSIADKTSVERLKKTLKVKKISVCAFTTVIPLAGPMTPPQVYQWVSSVAKVARQLRTPVIMMPLIARNVEDAQFIEKAREFVVPLQAVAKENGVQLTIENLGHYLNRKEVLDPILKSFDSRYVALTLDICNMYWFGHPLSKVYELAEHFAPYIRYAHVKNIQYPEEKRETQRTEGWEYLQYAEPVPSGDLDFRKIIGFYHKSGYRGTLTLEDDSLGKFKMPQLQQIHQKDVQHLREIVEQLSRGSGT